MNLSNGCIELIIQAQGICTLQMEESHQLQIKNIEQNPLGTVNFSFFNKCKIDNITYFPITKWIEKELSYDGLYVVNKIE